MYEIIAFGFAKFITPIIARKIEKCYRDIYPSYSVVVCMDSLLKHPQRHMKGCE